MIKKFFQYFCCILYAEFAAIGSLNAADSYNIKRVNNIFVGSLPNNPDLTMVMEPLDGYNSGKWKDFANRNSLTNVKDTRAGIQYFQKIVNSNIYNEYDVWIAYITGQPRSEIEKNTNDLSITNGTIKVITTVTSKKNALITSHLGIQSFTNIPFLSMPLHAFAANVSLIMNPKLRYMVNCPANIMGKIIAQELPENSVFIGTKEFKENIKKIYETWSANRDTKAVLDIMQKTPQILSKTPGKIILYDPQNEYKELLTMEPNNIYGWMFEEPFLAAPTTFYTAVDIKKLSEYVPEPPLTIALRKEKIDLIIGLQKKSSEKFNEWLFKEDKNGDYPLTISAQKNNTQFISDLLKETITPRNFGKALMLCNKEGNSPIMIAILNKNEQIVKLFLDTVNKVRDVGAIRKFYSSHANKKQQKLSDLVNQWENIDPSLKEQITKFIDDGGLLKS